MLVAEGVADVAGLGHVGLLAGDLAFQAQIGSCHVAGDVLNGVRGFALAVVVVKNVRIELTFVQVFL